MSYPWAAHLLGALTAPLHSKKKFQEPPPYPTLPNPSKSDRILVLAPHPDDETSLVGGYIATACDGGAEVFVVIISDGNAQNQKQRRFQELKVALNMLSVPKYECLELPDGQLFNHMPHIIRQIRDQVVRLKPTVIIFPHPFDQHSDHAAVGQAALKSTAESTVKRYSYPDHFPPQLPFPRRLDTKLFTWAPQAMAGNWVSFPLSAAALTKKINAVSAYRQELSRPILRSHLLATLRRNEIFEQH